MTVEKTQAGPTPANPTPADPPAQVDALPTQHPTPRRNWLPGIEVLRGIAAAMVVLHHSWSLSTMPRFTGYEIIEGFGSLGVNLFFLLSGFLLADQFWRPKEQRSLRAFWVRRMFRIAPAYYVTVAVLFLFFAQHSLLFSAQGLKQIIANATFMQYMLPSTSSSLNVNGALWTLTAEFLLYVTLPLMAIPFGRRPILTFLILIGIGVGWRLWIAVDGDALRDLYFGNTGPDVGIQSLFLARQFLGILPIFALGIGLKYLYTHDLLGAVNRVLPKRFSASALVIAMLPVLLLLFGVERASDFRHIWWFTFFDYVVAGALIPVLLIAARPPHDNPSVVARVGSWIGDRSYSLYIWHFPIVLSVYGRGPLVDPPDVSNPWLRLALIGVLSMTAAHISFVCLERPGIAMGRKIAARYSRPDRR